MKKHYDNDVLKQLHGKIVKRDIASYDIETYTNKNIFLMGGFIDAKGHYKSFFDKDTMISYMLKHTDKNTWIFATNNSFDHYALFGQEKTFLKEKPLLRGSLMIHSKYKHMNFYDTRAFTKATVEALGNMLGKPKIRLSMTNNKKHMTGKERRRMITYNKRDCEITRDFMKQLQEVLNNLGGNLKTTIGSSAMDLYRRKYLKENIHHEYNKQFSDGILLKDFLKRSYHGARTEMFKRGYDKDKIYYYYDFNSLYPSVMLTGYPKPSSAQLYRNNEGKINNTNLQFEGVSECEVLCPYMYYPLLSVYVNNKLCFPIGRFRGVFTHIELREAIKLGYKIIKIFRTVVYTDTITPFKEWVTDLYNLRLKYKSENNTIYSDIIKLLLNNLYGKFFQSNIKDFEFLHLEERDDKDLSQEGFTFDYNLGFGYRETPKESNQSFIIPIFSVYTTAKGRLKIYHKLKELKGVYCDTDSCMTEKKIQTSEELGELKLEYTCNGLNIAKPKHYSNYNIDKQRKEYKIKGIRLSKETDMKEEQFIKSITGKKILQIRFLTLKEAIKRQMKPNQKILVTKKIDLKDNKRVWIKPYSRNSMQDSEPLICAYDDLETLQHAYEKYKNA